MTDIPLSRKPLVVSSWAPPAPGASPEFFYNLFSQFDPSTFAIFTSAIWAASTTHTPRLSCSHISQGVDSSFIEKIFRGLRAIREAKIDVILGIADKGPALFLTFFLSLLSRKPYAVYLLDLYRWNNFGKLWGMLAHVFEPILFTHASVIFVMGDGHREFYEHKYGDRFSYTVIRNCPLPVATSHVVKKPGSPRTIVYTGSIYWAQEQSIRNLITAISTMNGLDVRFDLYTTRGVERFKKEFANNPRVSFHQSAHDEMSSIQSMADILFIPLAWRTPAPEVIEMATPGKTAEYLQSGRPILVHAPPESFLARYAKETGFGAVVDEESLDLLQSAVHKLLTDTAFSTKCSERALSLYYREYDLRENAERMAVLLGSIR